MILKPVAIIHGKYEYICGGVGLFEKLDEAKVEEDDRLDAKSAVAELENNDAEALHILSRIVFFNPHRIL